MYTVIIWTLYLCLVAASPLALRGYIRVSVLYRGMCGISPQGCLLECIQLSGIVWLTCHPQLYIETELLDVQHYVQHYEE